MFLQLLGAVRIAMRRQPKPPGRCFGLHALPFRLTYNSYDYEFYVMDLASVYGIYFFLPVYIFYDGIFNHHYNAYILYRLG